MIDIEMDKREIGRRLTELRGEKTQKEAAKGLGISASALSMYENGERIPRDNIKIRMASFYGKSVGDIFFAPVTHET